ncbi:MAG: regulatory iron-sulfur-containing complex subunit RicT [Bacteroidales bacterium]|nr:regulatory iron-sulfur-containing complex subunit RicT [Bacteroidales bacterium]
MKKEDISDNNPFLSRGFVEQPDAENNTMGCFKGSCSKLDVFDNPTNGNPQETTENPEGSENPDTTERPAGVENTYPICEVRFKNTSKSFYRIVEDIRLKKGDIVAVEANPGHDIGVVSATGETARKQLAKRGISEDSESIRKIYRKIKTNDIARWIAAVNREEETAEETKKIIASLRLNMKLNDVEFQGDGTKATFFYTAEDRVDFRELIKILADRFRIRIEMRQIGIRQEASRIGGVGSCGRELCCSTWLTKFSSVTTVRAKVQQLTLNPVKLAGQCGKLKCCLNFEYEAYIEALKEFPDSNVVLKTNAGDASYIKSDVFKKLMWYSYNNTQDNSMMAIPINMVKDIIAMNAKGKKPDKLEDFAQQKEERIEIDEGIVTPDDLTRFDD